MGRKTDKFIQDISEADKECLGTCSILEKLSTLMFDNGRQWTEKVMREMLQIGDWEKHEVAIERALIGKRGKGLLEKLRQDVNVIDQSLSDFKKFVQKKEKSKNPFKGKKSLRAAKDMIEAFEDIQKEFEAVLTKTGSAFR